MRFAAKLTAGQAEARIVLCADNRTVSAARADQVAQPMLANSRLGKLGETPCAGRIGINQGASNCALKIPKGPLKLLI